MSEQKSSPSSARRQNSRIPGLLLFALGIVFLIAGSMRGQDEAVFQKAIRICLECIGIG